MNILFISHYYNPHLGGVERHGEEIGKRLKVKGNNVTILTERYEQNLKTSEVKDGVKIVRFNYPHIKFIGLIFIWLEMWKKRDLILSSDIIHVHDVFVWYLPLRFMFPFKKVFLTVHGWEGIYPIPLKNILLKKLSASLSSGVITIGNYIGKYYKITPDKILYGGVSMNRFIYTKKKVKDSIVFVGRLESDTGVLEFLKFLRSNKKYKIDFVGDGSLRSECEKFGVVHGFCDPTPFYKKAETVVPSGYLTFLEAKSYGCKIKTFYSNPLKKDYWDEILKLKKSTTWEDVTMEYLNLWKK